MTVGAINYCVIGLPYVQQNFEIRIPAETEAGTLVYRLRRGEWPDFSVSSVIDGKLAMHGLPRTCC